MMISTLQWQGRQLVACITGAYLAKGKVQEANVKGKIRGRFCRSIFYSNSSTAAVSSTTQSKGCEGLQLSTLFSRFSITVGKDAVSSQSFLKCLFLMYHRIGLNCNISGVRVLQIVP